MSICRQWYNKLQKNWLILETSYKFVYNLTLASILIGYTLLVPARFIAAEIEDPKDKHIFPIFGQSTESTANIVENYPNSLPEAEIKDPRYVMYVAATAYSSTVDQCDSTPCITANGFNLCEHNIEDVIATNALPFGTKVRFPEVYGDKIFTVVDRMNAKYWKRVDFWKQTRAEAKNFGLKRSIKMEVL